MPSWDVRSHTEVSKMFHGVKNLTNIRKLRSCLWIVWHFVLVLGVPFDLVWYPLNMNKASWYMCLRDIISTMLSLEGANSNFFINYFAKCWQHRFFYMYLYTSWACLFCPKWSYSTASCIVVCLTKKKSFFLFAEMDVRCTLLFFLPRILLGGALGAQGTRDRN